MGSKEIVEAAAGKMASESKSNDAAARRSPSQLGKNWATGISGRISQRKPASKGGGGENGMKPVA